MTLQPIQDLFYFIVGAYNVCVSNWVLSIPIALAVIYYAYRVLKRTMDLLKKGS